MILENYLDRLSEQIFWVLINILDDRNRSTIETILVIESVLFCFYDSEKNIEIFWVKNGKRSIHPVNAWKSSYRLMFV